MRVKDYAFAPRYLREFSVEVPELYN